MACSICCETYNKQVHKKSECSFCELETCRQCVQQYLLSITTDPHCMGCKHEWNREYVDNVCTKTFRNITLKKHREDILLGREKCLIPETQPLVVREKNMRKLTKEIELLNDSLKDAEYNLHMLRYGGRTTITQEKVKFVRKCPFTECKGFLSTQWKCEVCDNWTCPDCNEIKESHDDNTHVCDPGNVETVKLLKKDSKPCPKCGVIHFRISGCPQMWCPSCHTAYNWNTGRIDTGTIHNPHFFEFQQGGGVIGRNNADIPCGGLPHASEYGSVSMSTEDRKTFVRIHYMIAHLDYVCGRGDNGPQNNDDIRIKYIMNEMTVDKFKFIIQKREKKNEKHRDINNILRMVIDTASDMLRQVVVGELLPEQCLTQIKLLKDYTNNVFKTIQKRYNCKAKYINNNWELN